MDRFEDRLGEPDLALAGFQLWVHGPDTVGPGGYDDWLRVTAHCGAHGASVWASGEIVQLGDLRGWIESVGFLHRELSGTARLAPLERNLSILLQVDRIGGIEMEVEITPDPAASGTASGSISTSRISPPSSRRGGGCWIGIPRPADIPAEARPIVRRVAGAGRMNSLQRRREVRLRGLWFRAAVRCDGRLAKA
ncbi:MAG TPA: hypothetical protein VFR81_19410 [Longimicrobium sp.]|nr:hypothetical protein [Longimicrobium sp.]